MSSMSEKSTVVGVSVRGSSKIHLAEPGDSSTLCCRRIPITCSPVSESDATCPECLQVQSDRRKAAERKVADFLHKQKPCQVASDRK